LSILRIRCSITRSQRCNVALQSLQYRRRLAGVGAQVPTAVRRWTDRRGL